MITVILACAALVVATSFLHYEVLRLLHGALPTLRIPRRSKLLVVIVAAFLAHALEIFVYGAALYALITWLGAGALAGALAGTAGSSFANCLYFSAETYTSLGFGDLTPVGPVRLLAGVEALNGLLLIGWSASFTYISMERFWGPSPAPE